MRSTYVIVVIGLLLIAPVMHAQWLPAGQISGPIYYNGGNVGIGTATPSATLDVVGGTYLEYAWPSVGGGYGILSLVDKTALATDVGGNIAFRGVYTSLGATAGFGGIKAGKSNATDGNLDSYLTLYTRNNSTGISERIRIDKDGKVGIGTATPTATLDVNGSINVSGNINAKYQDVAEWVRAREELIPGTVVVLDPEHANQVTASTRAYDTSVAGVVSARPGISLGEAAIGKQQIATTGRLKVRVDASRGGIRIGDLLVSADKPGAAMRSVPVQISGVKMHRPGTIIGKALEPLASGEGEILVLLSLQ